MILASKVMPLSSGVEVDLLSMQPHGFIQAQGMKGSGLRWPQVRDHKQPGFPLKELSCKHNNAGFGWKMETLETFKKSMRAKGDQAKRPFPGILKSTGELLQMPVAGERFVLPCALHHFPSIDSMC